MKKVIGFIIGAAVCLAITACGASGISEEDYNAVIDTDNGVMDVRCKPSGLWGRDHCTVMMETIAGGLELMAGQYPDFMTFERRE